jgi:hypothetical protein
MRISALVEIAPEIRELDLNPVKVLPPGHGAVVVDARIRVAPLGGVAGLDPARSSSMSPPVTAVSRGET